MASAIGSGKNPTYVDTNGRAVASTETVGSDTKPVYMEGGVLKETAKLAPLASPTFTGTPKAPTPTDASDGKQIANKEYVLSKIPVVPEQLTLADIYPVGSVYITMNADVPAAFKVGMTWVKLTEGRCLWNATNDQLGEDLEQGLPSLPSITGSSHSHSISIKHATPGHGSGPIMTIEGCYTNSTGSSTYNTESSSVSVNVGSSDVYGKTKVVRPPSIGVSMFKRTA